MLKAYLPVLVFLLLGLGVGIAFTTLNRVPGPSRPGRVKSEPYESGILSRVGRGFRFGISSYLVGMPSILFDIEVILLSPTAVAMGESVHVLGAIALFILFLGVTLVYEWRTARSTGGTERARTGRPLRSGVRLQEEQRDQDRQQGTQPSTYIMALRSSSGRALRAVCFLALLPRRGADGTRP